MTRVLLFPGQGSQRAGMGRELFDRWPGLVTSADDVLGYSVRRVCLEDPEGVLDQTRYTQPLRYVVNALAYREYLHHHGPPDLALGHSLGEYNALEAAGAFTFEDGLRLVVARAEGMAQITGGGMTAVLGFTETKLRFLLQRAGFGTIDLANLNTPTQSVLAGPVTELEEMEPILEDLGASAVRRLPVSGPFHSRYMRPAAEWFAPLAVATRFAPLRFPVVANRTARPHDEATLAATLSEQVDHPVRWADSIKEVDGPDVTFAEVGGGTVLTSMVRQIRRPARQETGSGR
jgi:malonyl CoA-acyl carrier protein transacylase